MIVCAFPGSGKSWLCQKSYQEHEGPMILCKDSNSHTYDKSGSWWVRYVDDLLTYVGKVDFIFISHHEEVQAELSSRGLPFVVVAPNNAYWTSTDKRQQIKQQWLGRYILRDNSHLHNFTEWFNDMRINYDEMTSIERLSRYKPVGIYLLEQDQYLSDVIYTLYINKEQHDMYTVNIETR